MTHLCRFCKATERLLWWAVGLDRLFRASRNGNSHYPWLADTSGTAQCSHHDLDQREPQASNGVDCLAQEVFPDHSHPRHAAGSPLLSQKLWPRLLLRLPEHLAPALHSLLSILHSILRSPLLHYPPLLLPLPEHVHLLPRLLSSIYPCSPI